jgi:tetratricopeptide (TPR) repeat protein
MRRAKYILCMLLVMHASFVAGQTRSEMREMFVTAESDILYEDYAEALPKYLNLLQIYPYNYNFYFRVGQCYLFTPGEKDKSVSFLETAAANISPKFRRGRFTGTVAPYDALYYLANAYRINGYLDKALETYALFMQNVDNEVYDTTLIRFQMESCHIARKMMANPVYVTEKNLGGEINGRFSDFSPVVSGDGNMIVFTRALQFYDAVFYSRKVNGRWTPPVNMTPQLGVDPDYYSSSLTGDGKTLLLYRTDNYEGNIYLSRFDGEKWSNVEKLNDWVNTKFWESHATMSKDGRKLYFTSNRKEGLGGLDIFVSERDSTGNWGAPKNAGPVINTVYNEESPFLANNDRSLFFSSRGHYNMGGYDIFRSDLNESGNWGAPVNLGYPVNTTDDDLFFTPAGDGNSGYIAKFDPEGYGKMDIFFYEIFSDRNPRRFVVTGLASVKNLNDDFPASVMVTASNNADASVMKSTAADPLSGRYTLLLRQGSYDFTWSAEGASDVSKTIEMPLAYEGDTVRIERVTLPNTDLTAELRLLGDTLLKVNAGDLATVTLFTEARSTLGVELISPDTIINLGSHRIKDTLFSFNIMPQKGKSHLRFSLIDRFGNEAGAEVHIECREIGYNKIHPKEERETNKAVPGIPEAETQSADKVTDTVPVQAAGTVTENQEPAIEKTEGKSYCWLWWLFLIMLLVVLYIIWRSRIRKN